MIKKVIKNDLLAPALSRLLVDNGIAFSHIKPDEENHQFTISKADEDKFNEQFDIVTNWIYPQGEIRYIAGMDKAESLLVNQTGLTIFREIKDPLLLECMGRTGQRLTNKMQKNITKAQ